eukprot:SAG31_NODE_130_length_23424_cov_45.648802_17_plen_83_part_00
MKFDFFIGEWDRSKSSKTPKRLHLILSCSRWQRKKYLASRSREPVGQPTPDVGLLATCPVASSVAPPIATPFCAYDHKDALL